MLNISIVTKKKVSLHQDQRGIASILITMVIMVVISLIILGFGQVSRREESQSLDRQLSSQAYYAAESGINLAVSALNSGYLSTHANGKTTCGPDGSGPLAASGSLNSSTVQYSCLLINPTPGTLSYSNIALDHSTIIPIQSVSAAGAPTDPGYLTFSWQTNDPAITSTAYNACPTNFNFTNDNYFQQDADWSPTPPNNCNAGVLQMDIVPQQALGVPGSGPPNAYCTNLIASVNSSLSLSLPVNSRTCLQYATKTIFLVPSVSPQATTVDYATLNEGQVVRVNCVNKSPCSINISDIGNLDPNYQAYFRVRSYYETNALTVTTEPSQNALLAGAQAVVDSTGEAQDVLRRIVANVPLAENFADQPEFAIQSGSNICKDFRVPISLTAGIYVNNSVIYSSPEGGTNLYIDPCNNSTAYPPGVLAP